MHRRWTFGLVAAGLIVIAWQVSAMGPTSVIGALARVGPVIAVVLVLELARALVDAGVASVVLGVRGAALLSAALPAYVASQLLPAGRLAGEVVRVMHLGRSMEGDAATGVLRVHGAYVVTSAAMGMGLAVGLGATMPTLATAVGACAAWSALVGAILCAASFAVPCARTFIARRGVPLAAPRPAPNGTEIAGWAFGALLSRGLHLAQAVALARGLGDGDHVLALGAAIEAMQHVAASLGDAVPGQLAVLEATFGAFASTAFVGVEPDRAAGLALVAALVLRITRLGLALLFGIAHLGWTARDLAARGACHASVAARRAVAAARRVGPP